MSGSPPRSRTRLDELSPDEALHLLQTQNRALRQRLTTANQAAEQHAALQAEAAQLRTQLVRARGSCVRATRLDAWKHT
jgi:hypothetical protein